MSILIKGVEMPKSCEECQVCDYEEGNCLLTGNRISDGRNTLPHNGERNNGFLTSGRMVQGNLHLPTPQENHDRAKAWLDRMEAEKNESGRMESESQ